jgi:GDP-4-dehydro-6-deoxy-D-mannose reductase
LSALAGRAALVTGAGGFVGPWVVRALERAEARVTGTGGPRHPELGIAWIESDLRDPASLDAAVAAARPDLVVHLAGQSSAAASFEKRVETFEVNAAGTWRLLEALARHAPRARSLVITSAEIYGPQPEGSRTAEDAPLRPVSPYGLSKAAADAFAELAAERGQDVIRARAFGHTGPGQDDRFFVPAMAKQIAAIERGDGERVLRVGNLEVTRDLADVRDVARAYVALLERGVAGRAYNVCRGSGVKLADVVRDLAARSRVPLRVEPDAARMRPSDVPWLVGDPGSIARDTGWRVEIPFERTLEDVLEHWRSREN